MVGLGEEGREINKGPNNLMAELEESIYSYSGTLQQKAFPGCTDIHNTDNSQSTALACTRGHDALRTAEKSKTECPTGIWTAHSKTKG